MGHEFSVRLKEAMRLRGITAAELSRLTGTPESVISQYKRGLYEPKQRRLQRFSEVLEVPIPWLMGLVDGPMRRDSDPETKDVVLTPTVLSEQEIELLSDFNSLCEDGQSKVLEYLTDIKASGKYSKRAK